MSFDEILFRILIYGAIAVGIIGGLVFAIMSSRQVPKKETPTRKFDWTK